MEGYIGEIRFFAGDYAPRNWAFCDGQVLSISGNQSLYKILGAHYGGDGKKTFALPDLRDRTAIGAGRGPSLSDYKLGQKAGKSAVTISVQELPKHNHVLDATITGWTQIKTSSEATTDEPGEHFVAPISGEANFNPNHNKKMGISNVEFSGSVSTKNSDGGDTSHPNIMPSIITNYIICIYGEFPVRN